MEHRFPPLPLLRRRHDERAGIAVPVLPGERLMGAARFIDKRYTESVSAVVNAFLAPPSDRPYRVTLEPSALFGKVVITLWNGGGTLHVGDAELQQLFDLLVDHFGMADSYPLSEFAGFWDESWGVDPRG
jgi:hypothetical protein